MTSTSLPPAPDNNVVSDWFWKLYIPLAVGTTLVVLGLYQYWWLLNRGRRRLWDSITVGRCGTGAVIRRAQGSQELYLRGF